MAELDAEQSYILGYLIRQTRNRSLAEDLTSETFILALRTAGTFRGGSVRAWLTTIARNQFINTVRSSARLDTDAEFVKIPLADEIRSQLPKLSALRGEFLRLRLIEGYSVEHTAAILGMPSGAVRPAQRRAIRDLCACLKQDKLTVPVEQCQWPPGCSLRVAARGHCMRHYNKLNRLDRLPDGLFTAAGPARQHLRTWIDREGRLNEFAADSGVTHSVLDSIAAGCTAKVNKSVARRILATPMRPSREDCLRYLSEFASAGLTLSQVASAAGCGYDALKKARQGRCRFTSPNAFTLRKMYENHLTAPSCFASSAHSCCT